MRSLLSFGIAILVIISSCSKQEFITTSTEESPLSCNGAKCVGIRIINNSSEDIDKITFGYWNNNKSNPIEFMDINAGATSNYQYIENLTYSYHYLDNIYLGFQFEAQFDGVVENYLFNYGYCGNGIISKEVNEAHFDITIEQLDKMTKTFYAKQERID